MKKISTSVKGTSDRLLSIDVFRGLTIFIMIFVNDLASIRNIPEWMKHMPADADGMTFVDVVFPAFLFIVGMAIPLALSRRILKGDSASELIRHIMIRTGGLLLLGVLMVNIGGLNAQATGIDKHVWSLLMFISAILTWNQYPKSADWKKYLYAGLKVTGFLMLILLVVIYRSGKDGNIGWLHTSWWGILGLIGWSYLVCCLLFLIFRSNLAAYAGILAIFIALYIGDKGGALAFLGPINDVLWIGGHIGGHASITLAGMILSLLFMPNSPAPTVRKRLIWIAAFTSGLLIGGYLLRPLYGISKIYATPSWGLYCSAICCVIFAFLYWLMDIKKITTWAGFLKPAGSNPLLAYILPDIVYFLLAILGVTVLSDHLGEGIIGIIRSLIFSLLMVGLTGLMTRLQVRLHL